jgi:hypothetical protein
LAARGGFASCRLTKGRCFMSDYEIYVFLLCLIVFLLLTALSVVCLSIITKLTLRLINCGEEDQKILEEYRKSKTKKGENKVVKILDHVFSGLVCFACYAHRLNGDPLHRKL